MKSDYTTKTLDEDQLNEAIRRAGLITITDPSHVLQLGAEIQRKIGEIDPEVTRLMMKELGPVGDLLISMQSKIGSLNAEDVFNMQPSEFDKFLERFKLLRDWFGPLARFARRYNKLEKVVTGYVVDIDDELSGLVLDVTAKGKHIELYQHGEIELLIEARVGEIHLERLELLSNKAGGETSVKSTQAIPNLETTIQILEQRVANLKVASNYMGQSWFQMETSKGSEWSLIEKVDSGKKMDVFMFRQAARAAASALRMCRVADLVNRSDEFRDLLVMTVAQLQKESVRSAGKAGTRAIIALAILQKTKDIAIESLREQRELFATSKASMQEADAALLDIRQELDDALRTEIPQA